MKPKIEETTPAHNCKERVDASIKERGIRLAGLQSDSFIIETVAIARKKQHQPVSVEATYCPFCGKKVKFDVKNN